VEALSSGVTEVSGDYFGDRVQDSTRLRAILRSVAKQLFKFRSGSFFGPSNFDNSTYFACLGRYWCCTHQMDSNRMVPVSPEFNPF
jgi:hypothetical protein